MVHRHDSTLSLTEMARDMWYFPGGKIEGSESPEYTIKRELEEELGISECEIIRQIPIIQNVSFVNKDETRSNFLIIPYIIGVTNEDIDHKDPKHLGHVWLTWEELLHFESTHPLSKAAIPLISYAIKALLQKED